MGAYIKFPNIDNLEKRDITLKWVSDNLDLNKYRKQVYYIRESVNLSELYLENEDTKLSVIFDKIKEALRTTTEDIDISISCEETEICEGTDCYCTPRDSIFLNRIFVRDETNSEVCARLKKLAKEQIEKRTNAKRQLKYKKAHVTYLTKKIKTLEEELSENEN